MANHGRFPGNGQIPLFSANPQQQLIPNYHISGGPSAFPSAVQVPRGGGKPTVLRIHSGMTKLEWAAVVIAANQAVAPQAETIEGIVKSSVEVAQAILAECARREEGSDGSTG